MAATTLSFAQTPDTTPAATPPATDKPLAAGARIFIEPSDGFETYLAAAFIKKQVPVVVVDDKGKADFVITSKSYVQKASAAKTIFISGAPSAGATITLKAANSGDVIWAYSVDKYNAARASQSTAEAVAKHLKERIEKGK